MISQRLIQYVQESLNSGYDTGAIRNRLVNQGYSENDVSDTIDYARELSLRRQGGAQMAKAANPEYAGFWIRFSAMIWDWIILGIPALIIQILVTWAVGINSMAYLVTLAALVVTVYMDGIKGGTPGKLMLGLRIQNEKGQYIGIPLAILRQIGKILSGIILGIGYLMIAWDAKKQGLHDKIAKTFVVKTKERKGLYVTGIVLGILGIVAIPILLIVGTIAYLGILSPDKFLPDKCTLQSGFSCIDFRVTPSTINVNIVNSLGYDVSNVVLTASDCGNSGDAIAMPNGGSFIFTINCNPPLKGSNYIGNLDLAYTVAATGMAYTNIGQISARIE